MNYLFIQMALFSNFVLFFKIPNIYVFFVELGLMGTKLSQTLAAHCSIVFF